MHMNRSKESGQRLQVVNTTQMLPLHAGEVAAQPSIGASIRTLFFLSVLTRPFVNLRLPAQPQGQSVSQIFARHFIPSKIVHLPPRHAVEPFCFTFNSIILCQILHSIPLCSITFEDDGRQVIPIR